MNSFDFFWTLSLLLLGLLALVVVRSKLRKTKIDASEPSGESPIPSISSSSNHSLNSSLSHSLSSTTLPMESTPVSQTEASQTETKHPVEQSVSEAVQFTQAETISPSVSSESQQVVLPERSTDNAESGNVEPGNSQANAETHTEFSVEPSFEAATGIEDSTKSGNVKTDDVEMFKQAFLENLLQFQGQSLQTANPIDCYIALAQVVHQQLSQLNSVAIVAKDSVQSRIVAELAIDFTLPSLLTTSLINLGMVDRVCQGLEELGLNLLDLSSLETAHSVQTGELDSLSQVLNGYLEALATARVAAIGYGMRHELDMSKSTDNTKTELLQTGAPHHFWEIEQTTAIVEVGFGGYTRTCTDEQGHRVSWFPETVIKAVPYDVLIPGYRVNQASILRLWQVVPGSDSSQLLSQPANTQSSNQKLGLKQYFFLVSCAVQDLLRLHLHSNASIETLHEQVSLHFNDAAAALAIVELMRWLVDEHKLDWQKSWDMTQTIFSCTLRDITPEILSDRWSIQQIKQFLPRHAEIIEELNQQFLAEIRATSPNYDRIRRMAVIDETGLRSLRAVHLACVGSHTVNASSTLDTRLLQQKILPDFGEQYPAKFATAIDGINARQYLLQGNPRLANLLTRWLGDNWITDSTEFSKLKDLVNNVEFCGDWWQTKRDIKQDFANLIYQKTGQSLNLSSLFDVQFMPIQEHHRQVLNLLHVITLYARLKINSNTDTIQRFAHRSVPRTCIFAGATANNSIAELISQLIQSVAAVVNDDPDVQGRLQVIYSADAYSTEWQFYAAADLSEHLTLASNRTFNINPLKFALNGSIILGTPSHFNLEMQQSIGTKSVFLFGRTATEEAELIAKKHSPQLYYNADAELRQAIDLIASGYFSYRDSNTFKPLIEWLLAVDPHLVLADYQLYINCQERLSPLYQDQKNWTRAAILTTAHMDLFCADRAILDRLHNCNPAT